MKAFLVVALLLVLVNPFTLSWVASLYVVSDTLEPADAIIPLRGSSEEEPARLEEAIELVRKRFALTLMVSVSNKPFYGQPIIKLIQDYLKQKRFPGQRLRFCQNNADSTAEEAQLLLVCLQQLGAKKAIIVTSEYHTRRTRFLFRRILSGSGVTVFVHPVYNRQFWDTHWWRRRRWTKTFVTETLSLLWNRVEQWGHFWSQSQPSPKEIRATAG